MSEDYEYTNWIDHDGKGFPHDICNQMAGRGFEMMTIVSEGYGRPQTPWEEANRPKVDPNSPSWTWKWSGSFGLGEWICIDPNYMRVTRYRFYKPKAFQEQANAEILEEIVQLKRAPSTEDA